MWLGNRRLAEGDNRTGRRLAFNVPSASTAANVVEAKMSCASQINGIISSFFAVSQYVSDSIYTCPPPNQVKSEYRAKCSMGISVLVSGLGFVRRLRV